MEFWLDDLDKSSSDAIATSISSLSQGAEVFMEPAILEVNSNRTIFWKFPLRLQTPCKHNIQNNSETCSLSIQIHSKSKDYKVQTLKNIHKWMVQCHTVLNNDSLQLHFVAISKYQQENPNITAALSTPSIQQKHYNVWLKWMSIFLALASLVLVILTNKHLCYQRNTQKWFSNVLAKSKKLKTSLWQKEMEDNILIVGYDGLSANIIGTNPKELQDSEQNSGELSQIQDNTYSSSGKKRGQEHFTRTQRTQLTILTLITASLIVSLMDLVISLK